MRLIIFSSLLFFLFSANATDQNYKKGSYTDWSGNKFEGYINHLSIKKIKFKNDPNSKPKSLTPEKIKSFDIGDKHFDVIFNFKYRPNGSGINMHYDKIFVEVIQKGKIELYKIRKAVNNGIYTGVDDYYFVNTKKELIQITSHEKSFHKQILSIVKDNQDLANMIVEQSMGYNQLSSIIEIYNK